jgi:hypothetical protein
MSDFQIIKREIIEDAYSFEQLENLRDKVKSLRDSKLISKQDMSILSSLIDNEIDKIKEMEERINHNPFYDDDYE